MRWFQKTVALLLLALWMPTTSHCLIETTGLLPDFLCCADACSQDSSQPGQDEDSCLTLESASYRLDEQSVVMAMQPLGAFWQGYFGAATVPEPASEGVPASPPEDPDLSVSWQFSLRTALSPRAPSFVS